MKRAIIEIDHAETALLRESLSPETSRTIPRTSVDIREVGDRLQIDIQASDVNALRAAINSYLRWVSVGIEAVSLTSKG